MRRFKVHIRKHTYNLLITLLWPINIANNLQIAPIPHPTISIHTVIWHFVDSCNQRLDGELEFDSVNVSSSQYP